MQWCSKSARIAASIAFITSTPVLVCGDWLGLDLVSECIILILLCTACFM